MWCSYKNKKSASSWYSVSCGFYKVIPSGFEPETHSLEGSLLLRCRSLNISMLWNSHINQRSTIGQHYWLNGCKISVFTRHIGMFRVKKVKADKNNHISSFSCKCLLLYFRICEKKKNGTPLKISLSGVPLAMIMVCAILFHLVLTNPNWTLCWNI